jgi:hypothetical protein
MKDRPDGVNRLCAAQTAFLARMSAIFFATISTSDLRAIPREPG